MKKILALLSIFLVGLLVVACVPRDGPKTSVEVQPQEAPESPPETVLEPSQIVEAPESEPVETSDVKPIGSRFKPVEDDSEPVDVPVSGDAILLTPQKLMSKDLKVITKGESVTWKNTDSAPHQLVIELNGVRLSGGVRIDPGQAWTYTFDRLGEHLVRDIFSGNMRMLVRVES
jgi:hypothetical protein